MSRFLEAARLGDAETLRLLTSGRKAASAPLVRRQDAAQNGTTTLHSGSSRCHTLLMRPPCCLLQMVRETLFSAASRGDLAAVSAVLSGAGAEVVGAALATNVPCPLLAACFGGHAGCAAALLEAGASTTADAARAAIQRDDAACLRALLAHGFRFGNHDRFRLTLRETSGFLEAAAADAVGCMAELARVGIDSRTAGMDTGQLTPLIIASD